MNRNLHQQPAGMQTIVLIGLSLVGLLLATVICFIVVPLVSGISLINFASTQNFDAPGYMNAFISSQLTYQIFGFIAPAIAFGILSSKNAINYLGLNKPKKTIHWLLPSLALLVSMGFVALLAEWNLKIPMPISWLAAEDLATTITKKIMDVKSIGALLFTIFYIALIPAIAEELLFRSGIQRCISRYMPENWHWLAVVITGFIFGVAHGQMQSALPRIFLGILLGFAYLYTKNIWVCVLAHFINNALSIILNYAYAQKWIATDFANATEIPFIYGALSGFLSFFVIYILYKQSVIAKEEITANNIEILGE